MSAEPHLSPSSPPHTLRRGSLPPPARWWVRSASRLSPSALHSAHYTPAECHFRDPDPDPSQLLMPRGEASAPPPIARGPWRREGDLPRGQHTAHGARAGSHVVSRERAAPPLHAPRASVADTPLGLAPPPCPRTLLQTREGRRALVPQPAGCGVGWDLGWDTPASSNLA